MTAAQEIISGAVNDYGNSFVDRAKTDYLHGLGLQQSMALLGAKQAGEEKIEGMRNESALERVKAQVQGYIDRLDEKQKGKDLSKWKALGIVPNAGEETDDFLARAAVEHGKHVANKANSIWKAANVEDSRITTLGNQENTRLAGLAVQRAKDQFAPSLGKDLQPLLKSQSVEQVLSSLPPKQQAPLRAQWEQILEGEQQRAMKEFNPVIKAQITAHQRNSEALMKQHAATLGESPFAGEYLKFEMPEAPQTFDEALAAASKKAKPSAAASTAAAGTKGAPALPMQFLPSALQDPDVLGVVQKYHPMGENFQHDSGDILDNTRAAIKKRLQASQETLAGLPVAIVHDKDGNTVPVIPKTQSVQTAAPSFGGYFGSMGSLGQPTSERALTPAEQQKLYDRAQEVLTGIKESSAALQKLTPPAGGTPIDASSADVLGGDWGDY